MNPQKLSDKDLETLLKIAESELNMDSTIDAWFVLGNKEQSKRQNERRNLINNINFELSIRKDLVMYTDSGSRKLATGLGCLIMLVVFGLMLSIGPVCFDYCLFTIFGKDIPWYGDLVAGTILSETCVPGAIVCWILVLCGVPTPFIS